MFQKHPLRYRFKKYRYTNILNDAAVAALSNFGSMGNVLMSDFCGDPAVWSKQIFHNDNNQIVSANGRSLVSLVVYINKQKFTGKKAVATAAGQNGLMLIDRGKDKRCKVIDALSTKTVDACSPIYYLQSMDSDPVKKDKQTGLLDTNGYRDDEEQKAIVESPRSTDDML